MKTTGPFSSSLEITIGGATVIVATLACLLASSALGVLALAGGAVSYGIVLGREGR
jgi:hypothetical protein